MVKEDERAICSKKSNLSNNHIESEKDKWKKDKCQNINLKSLREENPNRPLLRKLT